MFESLAVYEICFRAKEGLPLPSRRIIKLVVESALARTQRDDKVILCNYVWMANHPHILVLSKDVVALRNFYGELKKRITDMLKRLLGLSELQLWEEKETRVIRILDLEEAKRALVYHFLNPVKAELEDSIDRFPGESTWRAFCSVEPHLNGAVETIARWVRLPSIPVLSSNKPSLEEEGRVINYIRSQNKQITILKVQPLAWLKAFGVTNSSEIEAIRSEIIERVRAQEQAYREQRVADKRTVRGQQALMLAPIALKGHQPTKKGGSIHFRSSILSLRAQFCNLFKIFNQRCRACYESACKGNTSIDWPYGAFVPPIPPLVNPLALLR